MSNLQCCCGRRECAYLEHNNAALEGLEKDVETAAQLGQALLVRHESYMAEAEQERGRVAASIEKLEEDKRDLEAANARMIEENRGLLNQLEDLNNAAAESDAHLKSLAATLAAAQLEVKRLSALAQRTALLEEQLASMEAEEQQMQVDLDISKEYERSAVQRWKSAESTLRNLQDQVERIEKEAREEKEKHVELIGRMERRRTVEKELDNAAGRLKSAAAARTLGSRKDGTSVVSHFVRDILQDNANLQMGIVELREMLQSSNEEVQNLREQILLHQPIADESENPPTSTSISDELDLKSAPDAFPELHVHHHYHTIASTPSTPQKERIPLHRRPKKKRGSVHLGSMTPSSGTQTPRTPSSHLHHPSPSSTAAAILSQTSVSIPPGPNSSHRWSIQSSATGTSLASSSLPSSPRTDYRSSSIFDRMDYGFDSSRPTSPESNGFNSPNMLPSRDKRFSNISFRSISESAVYEGQSATANVSNPLESNFEDANSNIPEDGQGKDSVSEPDLSPLGHPPIPEEIEFEDATSSSHSHAHSASHNAETETEAVSHTSLQQESSSHFDVENDFFSRDHYPLKRSTSHESLLSISGMDIHTLRERPSQLLLGRSGIALQARTNVPILSTTNVVADTKHQTQATAPSIHSSQNILSTVASSSSSITTTSNSDSGDSGSSRSGSASKLPSRMGGWVWGRWGVAPTHKPDTHSPIPNPKPANTLRAQAIANANAHAVKKDPPPIVYEWGSGAIRAPGVNQKGPIRGLRPPTRTPSQIHAITIDEEGLREAMQS